MSGTLPYIIIPMPPGLSEPRLRGGKLMREFELKFKDESKDTELLVYSMIVEDLEKTFDWFRVYGWIPDIAVHYARAYNLAGEASKMGVSVISGNLSLEIAYTLLKLSGVDVSRYGLEEVYYSVENSVLVEEK